MYAYTCSIFLSCWKLEKKILPRVQYYYICGLIKCMDPACLPSHPFYITVFPFIFPSPFYKPPQ